MAVKVRTKKRAKARKAQPTVTKKEMTRLGAALRSLGSLGGAAAGGLVGMPQSGASLGHSLGATISRWLGAGDYSVSSNSIVSRSLKGSDAIPSMHSQSQSVVIRHKEYIGEIRSSTTFLVMDALQLNPGNNRTFPWLSTIANSFQEYKIRGMVFHYVPTSGAAISGTNAALGSVMMSTSYRANDAAPASKVELLNEFWSSESVPSESFCHPIECDPKENPFNVQYVRSGNVPDEDSRLLYDLGVTYIAVSGQQSSGNVIGDLWCTYEIELKKPLVYSNVTSASRWGTLSCMDPTLSGALWFVPGSITTAGSITLSASTRSLSFPEGCVGTWLVNVYVRPTTTFTVCNLSGSASVTNCTKVDMYLGIEYLRQSFSGGGGTVGDGFYAMTVRITDPSVNASITFPSSSITGSIEFYLVNVTQMS